ncbi:MAG: ATP-binding protein [Prolixibacteraceae bacterium]|jgi:predicted AAA+ superfamily ATPase|nr:ATP-binding protein [Prolixibacteraceae bacterium]
MKLDRLYTWSYQQIKRTNSTFKRYLYERIDWNNRLNIIIGMRGTGKTTMMLQYAKEELPFDESTIYISLDDIYFTVNHLVEFAEEFVKRGGKYLLIDEAQKYPNWSKEVKMIFDNFPELKMIISGSSAIEILKGEGDLSRRAIIYELHGLSLREYINLKYDKQFTPFPLNEIITKPTPLSISISESIKPIKIFEEYLQNGYYPFSLNDENNFSQRMMQVINVVLEIDIPSINNIDYNAVLKMKKLLGIIAESVPFKPNVTKLANQLLLSRETLLKYFTLLTKADVISTLYSSTKGISALNKPEKIYLQNPNLAHLLSSQNANTGNIRETFFLNQLQINHQVEYPPKGDFLVDKKFTFEVGGKNKSTQQIKDLSYAYIAADNIEIAVGNKIPLWLFGFMY